MTSGVLLKKPARYGMKAYIAKPMNSASIIAQTIPKRAPFFARPYSRAPRFWLVYVVSAMVKLVIGKKAKPSSLLYVPQAAMAIFPKVLMFACTITFAKPMTEF